MKKIILTLFFLSVAISAFGEVQFLNVGGPETTRTFELKTFQHNESKVEIIKVSVTHDINGKYYTYIVTPIMKDNRRIKEAEVQFWCDPINLQFYNDSVLDKDRKIVVFRYGIDDNLKEKMRMKVSLQLDNGNSIIFNIDDRIEKTGAK